MVIAAALATWQATVSFSAPAAPAAKLLPKLSQAVGVKMESDARLAREVLLIQAKNVPIKDLMERIAQATGGEWAKEGETYRLTLSSGNDAKDRQKEAIARGEAMECAASLDVMRLRGIVTEEHYEAGSRLLEAVVAMLTKMV